MFKLAPLTHATFPSLMSEEMQLGEERIQSFDSFVRALSFA